QVSGGIRRVRGCAGPGARGCGGARVRGSVEEVAEQAAEQDSAQHSAENIVPAAVVAPPAALARVLWACGVDVALRQLQGLARQLCGAPCSVEAGLQGVLLVGEAVDVGTRALGFGEAGARIRPNPPAMARDDAACDRDLPIGVVDRVP